jgi:hypothetical protein
MGALSTITIKELAGPGRRIVLRGPSLPFQGAGWGGEGRLVTTWYPGNAAEATQHVLGPVEVPSSWVGVWRTTQLFRTSALYDEGGGEQQVQRAFVLGQLLEEIFRQQQRLRVEWTNKNDGDTTARRIVREGRAASWDFDYDRSDDINWSIVFDWVSRGTKQQKVVASRQEDVQAALSSSIVAASAAAAIAADLQGFFSDPDIPGSASSFSLGDLENIVDAPLELARSFGRAAQQISDRFKQIGDLVQKVRTLPTQLANQALDVANNAVSIANNFIDQMSSRPAETNALDIKVSDLTRSSEAFVDMINDAESMADAADELRRKVKQSTSVETGILAVHTARGIQIFPTTVAGIATTIAGETLADISRRFYGTVDNAPQIALTNSLPAHQQFIEIGGIVIIPKLDKVVTAGIEGG